ncbi:hypothetical protein BCR44DRAFT_1053356 [Catenaria anguillulae PL171]|uniref:Signal peptidase complex subunit 2 n=1 Tax=Catenaria anguillulae PL171 TaxID=765915 RepID=A0A1Y2HTM8_9FUNG|nr:hypothetical protein BCR44DRAFT_1053356 [Catenaria anguillulae PL171]
MTGFAATKDLVTYTVLVYILLSVVTSVILMVYESKYLAEAALADGTQVTLATSISDDAEWKVEVVVTTAKGRKAVVRQVKGFGEYFSESGKLVGDKVYGDVCAWMQEAQTQLNK